MKAIAPQPMPTAHDVATLVPAVRVNDMRLTRPIEDLREHRVSILVDEKNQPIGILTTCDVSDLTRRIEAANPSDGARALFVNRPDTVSEDTPLDQVASRLAELKLGTGIVVVDSSKTYRGYAYSDAVRRKLEEFVKAKEAEVDSRVQQLRAEYPDALLGLSRVRS